MRGRPQDRGTFRSDSEFDGGLGVKLPCDWQILSLLKSANARPGSETEHTIDFPSVVSLPFSVSCIFLTSSGCATAGTSLLRLAPEASGVGNDPERPVVSNRKTMPAHAALPANNISSLYLHTIGPTGSSGSETPRRSSR